MRQRDRQSSGQHLAVGRNQGERENERRTSGQDEDKDEEETLNNRDTQAEEKKSNYMTDFHSITQPSWQVISSSSESSSSMSSSRSAML